MKQILYVDDDQQIRQLMQMYLKTCGYQVIVAEEGAEALKLMESSTVDLLITDINMPNGMGGIDLVKNVKQSKNELPIIVVSGYMKNDELVSEFGNKVCYFEKPVNLQQLTEKINSL